MDRATIAICALLLFAAGAGAETWTVAPDGTGDFLTIQEAIDAAIDGDEVRIRPGTYVGALNTHGKALTLIGEEGAEATIVDAGRAGSALQIPLTPGEPRVVGLTFTNGIGTILQAAGRDGRFGGGVWIEVAFPRFESCRFTANTANTGGGVYILSGGPTFVDCVFDDNGAGIGGGVALELDSGARLEGCEIRGNQSVFGGGIHGFRSLLAVDGCAITGNAASEGGGIYLRDRGAGSISVAASLIAGNAAGDGAGLYMRDASLGLEGCTIAGNSAGAGGAVVDLDTSDLTIAATIVSADSEEELVRCGAPSPTVDCSIFWGPAGMPPCVAGGRTLFADPFFCAPEEGDFTVREDSPCLPGQGPAGCGRIGAFNEGCDAPVPAEATGWGRVKALWGRR